MPQPFGKVNPGDPLAIPAAAYNAFVDAARANQADGNALLQVPQSAFQQSGIILVRNDSGADRDRFDVLGIDEPVFDPADDEDTFKNRVVLAGVTPTAAVHAGRFVVLLEPVASGEVGRACIAGVSPAWVNFQTEGDAFADVYDSDATQLKGGAAGAAQVLWKQEGTGPLWAVVRLGPDPAAVRWGVIFDYPPDPNETVNSISVHPCDDAQGGGVDESVSRTLFVASPVSVSPTAAAPNFHDGDVVAYLPFPGPQTGAGGVADGIVVSPDLSAIFAGHNLLDGDLHGDTDDHTPPNAGDIIYADGQLWKALPIGAAGTVLKVVNGFPAWGQGAAGANRLLDGVNHSDTVLCVPAAGDLVYANGAGSWDALGVGANNAVLYVDPATGLPDWFAPGAAQSLLSIDAGGDLNWFAGGGAGAILTMDAGPALSWLAAGAGKTFLTIDDGTGLPAWKACYLLDATVHPDTIGAAGQPHHGEIIVGSDVLGGGQAWQGLVKTGTDGRILTEKDSEPSGLKWTSLTDLASASGVTIGQDYVYKVHWTNNSDVPVTKTIANPFNCGNVAHYLRIEYAAGPSEANCRGDCPDGGGSANTYFVVATTCGGGAASDMQITTCNGQTLVVSVGANWAGGMNPTYPGQIAVWIQGTGNSVTPVEAWFYLKVTDLGPVPTGFVNVSP